MTYLCRAVGEVLHDVADDGSVVCDADQLPGQAYTRVREVTHNRLLWGRGEGRQVGGRREDVPTQVAWSYKGRTIINIERNKNIKLLISTGTESIAPLFKHYIPQNLYQVSCDHSFIILLNN